MSKGSTFVIGYSVVLLGLFGLSCYLMSTVNPKPLESTPAPTGLVEEDVDARREFNIDFAKEVGGEDGALGYGLEKVSGDEATAKPRPYSRMIPLYRHLLRHGGFVNSSLVRDVVPPIVPSMMRLSTTTTTTQRPMFYKKKTNSNTTLMNTLTAKFPSAKGFRRSVNEMETNLMKEEQSSGVILKIIDDSGRSRIEIKLGPNGSFEGNKLRHYRSSGNSSNGDHVRDDDNKSSANTVIKILPNNTMVFEEIDHSLVSLNVIKDKTLDYNEKRNAMDTNSSVIGNSIQENEANFEEIVLLVKSEPSKNDSSDVSPMNNTEMYTLKMLIDNETKSINQVIKNTVNVKDTIGKQRSVSYIDKTANITIQNNVKGDFQKKQNWRTFNHSQTKKPIHLVDINDLKDLQVL